MLLQFLVVHDCFKRLSLWIRPYNTFWNTYDVINPMTWRLHITLFTGKAKHYHVRLVSRSACRSYFHVSESLSECVCVWLILSINMLKLLTLSGFLSSLNRQLWFVAELQCKPQSVWDLLLLDFTLFISYVCTLYSCIIAVRTQVLAVNNNIT